MSRIGCVCIRVRKHIVVKCRCWCSHIIGHIRKSSLSNLFTELLGSEAEIYLGDYLGVGQGTGAWTS